MKLKVKEWFLNKTQETATRYNTCIDFERNEDDTVLVVDGYATVYVEEKLAETEKAVQVKLHTGNVLGSYKGWTVWVPKSVIA